MLCLPPPKLNEVRRGDALILRVKRTGIGLANSKAKPGPAAGGGYYVEITDVPAGVSLAQVVILFIHTAAKRVEKEGRYEFSFSELS